jgi:hypothetical protein
MPTVEISYADPSQRERAARDKKRALTAFNYTALPSLGYTNHFSAFGLQGEDAQGDRYHFGPALSMYFNDPSGALKYDFSMIGGMAHNFGGGLVFRTSAKATVVEDVSDVTQASNSVLPHVRTDIADYKRGGRFKVLTMTLNQYFEPARRVYARVSAGIYEEMYAGVGGQVLYLPARGRWAADLSADYVQQRNFRGLFGFRSYRTLTAIGSFHYRLPYDLTATLRAGRFLARDVGARFELSRRFKSGIEIGGWYTVTDGKDITTPGSPNSPYHDKGVFIRIPLRTMLTYDTQAVADLSLSPWTRDVGQMVKSPDDLYERLEEPLIRDFQQRDRLSGFGDVND